MFVFNAMFEISVTMFIVNAKFSCIGKFYILNAFNITTVALSDLYY